MSKKKINKTKNNLKLIFSFMKGNRLIYVWAILSMIAGSVFSTSIPFFIKLFIDSVLSDKPFTLPTWLSTFLQDINAREWLYHNLWFCGLVFVGLYLINGIFTFLKGRMAALASENTGKQLRDRLYNHIMHLPYDYHVKNNTGDIIQRCSSDVENLQGFVAYQLIEIINSIFNFILIISTMLVLSPALTGFSVVLTPAVFIVSIIIFKKMSKLWRNFEEAEGELTSVIQENISGVRVVKAFGAQSFEIENFSKVNQGFRSTLIKIITPIAMFWSSTDLLCLSQYFIIILVGVPYAIKGVITIGTFASFLTYIGMLIWPVRHLAQMIANMGQTLVAAERINEILMTPIEGLEDEGLKPEIHGDIEFNNVSLKYEGSSQPVLKNLSFKIKKGQTVAILGSTGSGKSSIAHLLLRLYDYTEGSIKIDGVELKDINKKWIRHQLAIVLQEPFLFGKTIKQNILFGNPKADDTIIHRSSRIAAIHDTILGLDKGYDTLVGEKGVTLSGGQRQRVAIARTVIRNSPVLIFDDSLSAVDMETDAAIRASLKELSKDTTSIIISHRITTLSDADLILVLENGQITQQGTHQELVSQEGLYKRVCHLQG